MEMPPQKDNLKIKSDQGIEPTTFGLDHSCADQDGRP